MTAAGAALRWPEDEALLRPDSAAFEIEDGDATAAVRRLARRARTQVRSLVFRECERVADAAEQLDVFPNLEHLELLGDEAAEDPELSDALASLEARALRSLRLSSEFVPIALVTSDYWSSLTSLTLDVRTADAVAVCALFPDDGPRLRELSLEVGRSFDGRPLDLAATLAELGVWGALRSLATMPLGPSLAGLLAACPSLRSLTVRAPKDRPVPQFDLSAPALEELIVLGALDEEARAACRRALPRLPPTFR